MKRLILATSMLFALPFTASAQGAPPPQPQDPTVQTFVQEWQSYQTQGNHVVSAVATIVQELQKLRTENADLKSRLGIKAPEPKQGPMSPRVQPPVGQPKH